MSPCTPILRLVQTGEVRLRASLLIVALVLCGRAAQDAPETPIGEDAKKKWQELHDQNLIVAEQQKLLTHQQGVLKLYLPNLPKGVTPGLERKGDVSVVAGFNSG